MKWATPSRSNTRLSIQVIYTNFVQFFSQIFTILYLYALLFWLDPDNILKKRRRKDFDFQEFFGDKPDFSNAAAPAPTTTQFSALHQSFPQHVIHRMENFLVFSYDIFNHFSDWGRSSKKKTGKKTR